MEEATVLISIFCVMFLLTGLLFVIPLSKIDDPPVKATRARRVIPVYLWVFRDKAKDVWVDKDVHDWKGRPVSHAISFDTFLNDYLKGNCHDFVSWGFLYDEGGVYGFSDVLVGFRTANDMEKYKHWRELNIHTSR